MKNRNHRKNNLSINQNFNQKNSEKVQTNDSFEKFDDRSNQNEKNKIKKLFFQNQNRRFFEVFMRSKKTNDATHAVRMFRIW